MDKMKTSIPRMRRKTKSVSAAYNVSVHLIDMLTHGHMYGGFGHFGLPSLDGGLNYRVSFISLYL